MDQKLEKVKLPNGEGNKKEKPDPLPNNDDEFWKEAKREICILKEMTCQKKEHEFVQTKSMEAKCVKCPVGYILPLGGEVKQRHIHIFGELVI